jgi:ureidoacrylate peracid hydrolase
MKPAAHAYRISAAARERMLQRRGWLASGRPLHPGRTALVVIDMQNHFVAEGGFGEVPPARVIVPAINELAAPLRAHGVPIVWIQTTARDAFERWPAQHRDIMAPERARRRLASLDESAPGFALYPGLDVRPGDLRLTKIHYSALTPGSSTLHAELQKRSVDTVLIAGTATNVCCESTGRDAMMHNYRAIIVSDCTATWTDAEQAATLDLFASFFGDVLTADEVLEHIGRAAAVEAQSSAMTRR